MILSSEYVLRAIELRLKTQRIVGTLCSVEDPVTIWNAMKYHQCYNHGKYISHPFVELDQPIYDNMDLNIFKIYVEMIHFWMPPCTSEEIRNTIYTGNIFGYDVTCHKNFISLRRIKHDTELSSSRY